MTAPSLSDVARISQVEQLHGVMSEAWERQQRPPWPQGGHGVPSGDCPGVGGSDRAEVEPMTATVPPQRPGSDVREHAPSTTAALDYFARQIRGFRQQLNLSQSEVETAFGVDKQVWGSYERGDRVPTLPAFLDLCARTGLHWEELLPPSEDTGPRVLSAEERAQVLRETADMIVARDARPGLPSQEEGSA